MLTPDRLRVGLLREELRLKRGWPPLSATVWDPYRKRHKPLSDPQKTRWSRVYEVAHRYFRKRQRVTSIARKLGLPHQTVSSDLAVAVQHLVNYGWLLDRDGNQIRPGAESPVKLS